VPEKQLLATLRKSAISRKPTVFSTGSSTSLQDLRFLDSRGCTVVAPRHRIQSPEQAGFAGTAQLSEKIAHASEIRNTFSIISGGSPPLIPHREPASPFGPAAEGGCLGLAVVAVGLPSQVGAPHVGVTCGFFDLQVRRSSLFLIKFRVVRSRPNLTT